MSEYQCFIQMKVCPLLITASTIGVGTANHTIDRHNGGNGTINLVCGFGFISFDVPSRVRFDVDVIHHSTENRLTAVSQFFHRKFHQFLPRMGYIFVSLTERHYRKSNALVLGEFPDCHARRIGFRQHLRLKLRRIYYLLHLSAFVVDMISDDNLQRPQADVNHLSSLIFVLIVALKITVPILSQ